MAIRRGGGAFAALALAGLAYFFRNRKQVTNTVKQLTNRAQSQFAPSNNTPTTTTSSEPAAYTGDTVRM